MNKRKWKKKFWSKVSVLGDEDCWEYQGCVDSVGYGFAWSQNGQANTTSHRVAWETLYGDVPNNMEVGHRCKTKNCVNPSHLYLTSHTNNMREVVNREKYIYPINANDNDLVLAINKARALKYSCLLESLDYSQVDDEKIIEAYSVIFDKNIDTKRPNRPTVMVCGHQNSYVVSGADGTSFCLMCEFITRNELVKNIISAVDEYNT